MTKEPSLRGKNHRTNTTIKSEKETRRIAIQISLCAANIFFCAMCVRIDTVAGSAGSVIHGTGRHQKVRTIAKAILGDNIEKSQ